ncbi:MAG: helix-turn-helix domain-containing protein [bacterium]|nr:helix-turn-helix domain-containing protein [bacterium]
MTINYWKQGLRTIFALCLMLLALDATALDPDKTIDQYVLKQWTTANKLPGNTVIAIAQTPNGYLWAATPSKLFRYDGKEFKHYNVFSLGESGYKEITSLAVDPKGVLWIGTRGKGLYRLEKELFEIFTKKTGLSSNFINCLYSDHKSRLWIGTEDGYLNCFENDTFTRYDGQNGLPNACIYSIFADSKGTIWVGTRSGGLYRFLNRTFTKKNINNPGGKNKSPNLYDVTFIAEDTDEGLWVGTNHGLVQMVENDLNYYGRNSGLAGHTIYCILRDSDRNLWVGSGNGLFRLHPGVTTPGGIEKYLSGTVVRTIFEDHEKSIWMGTDGKGLIRLRDGKIKTFSADSGLPHEYVVYMHEDARKDIRIGTMDGMVCFKDGQLTRNAMKVEFSDAVVGPIFRDHTGDIWFSTYGSGLRRLTADGSIIRYTVKHGLLSDTVISLFNHKDNELWIGTDRGLNFYKDGLFTSLVSKHPLLKNSINCIYMDKKGTLWFGTGKGIVLYENGRFRESALKGLPDNPMVSYIYEDTDGNYWLTTKGNGLIRLKQDNSVQVFNTRNGLYSSTLYQVFEDDGGYLWISCDKEIFKVAKSDLELVASGKMKRLESIIYDRNDGLKSHECSRWGQHSSLKTSDGRLLFGTPGGISIIEPEHIKINRILPGTLIQRIVVENVAVNITKNDFLFRSMHYIQFHFRASTLIAPHKIKFRYRLKGFEKKWREVKPSMIKMAHYKDLPPGNYTFHVTAANSDGIWDDKGASFTFLYKPHFTRSPLFVFLVILLVLLLAAAISLGIRKFLQHRKLKNKYKTSHLEERKVDDCLKKLRRVMEVDKLYKDENLSLQTLAQHLSVTHHILSQVINEQLDKNFSDMVNSYRIEEAQRMLRESGPDDSILEICYEVGFNSKSAFYRAFKKFTEITPSQYQKIIKKNDKG